MWEVIADEFNRESIHVKRSWLQLKNFYEHAKHDAKKELAEDRVSDFLHFSIKKLYCMTDVVIMHLQRQTFMTGGGPKSTKISDIAAKTLQIIQKQVTPDTNCFDSSANFLVIFPSIV
jgi:Myb/SANT-like DNA-binding domain